MMGISPYEQLQLTKKGIDMYKFKKLTLLIVLPLIALLLSSHLNYLPQLTTEAEAALIHNEWNGHRLIAPFVRSNFDDLSPSGHSIATDCQDPNADYPYTPYDWPDATALLALEQQNGASSVHIKVRKARPYTFFTVWLRLKGTDLKGNVYGGNPFTGSPGTPLAPTSDLPKLLASSAPHPGSDQDPNGFYTDENGDANFSIDLDFPIINGAYPFHRFAGFDPTDERLAVENPAIYPVAIVGRDGPFTLRIVSHCTDNLGHGLSSGLREWWFLWKFE